MLTKLNRICLVAAVTLIFSAAAACGRAKHQDDDHTDDGKAEKSQNDVVGTFRGYAETNRVINERLFSRPNALALADYFEPKVESGTLDLSLLFGTSLRNLLGGYAGDGLHDEQKNALPNSVNMLLWYMAADGLAADFSAACDLAAPAPAAFALADVETSFSAAVSNLCGLLAGGGATADDYAAIWRMIMAADAPDAEMKSWLDLAASERLNAAAPRDHVHELIVAAIYNPYFLLKQ